LERRALDELQRLATQSHRFRRVLRKHGSYSRRTRDAYQHLVLAHHDVRYALAGLPVYSSTRRQLIRVDELMWRLRSRYSARLDRHHDRYGRRGRASVHRYHGESEFDRYGRGRAGASRQPTSLRSRPRRLSRSLAKRVIPSRMCCGERWDSAMISSTEPPVRQRSSQSEVSEYSATMG